MLKREVVVKVTEKRGKGITGRWYGWRSKSVRMYERVKAVKKKCFVILGGEKLTVEVKREIVGV